MKRNKNIGHLRLLYSLALMVAGLVVLTLVFSKPALASFLFEVKILSKEEIAKLSDQALQDTYIDVEVELEANKTFHQNSGFHPNEFAKYKDLLRFRIYLLMEFEKRGLQVPAGPPVVEPLELNPKESSKPEGLLQSPPPEKGK